MECFNCRQKGTSDENACVSAAIDRVVINGQAMGVRKQY